jgi:zinc transport system ATP-binding protein
MNAHEVAVKFDSVSFAYGDTRVLDNASFHIHCGEFIAMVGPNGSGKTTALKLLFGLEKPASGKIELFGKNGSHANGLRANLAYVPQYLPSDQMFPITVKGIVRMGLLKPFKGYSGAEEAVTEAMRQAGIADIAQRPYRSLSGGQKRRTLVARALAANPDLLVLDEPTANMDSESEKRLYETLAFYKGKTTILIVTHDTEFVTSLTDRVLCLGDGSRSVVQHRIEQVPAGHHGGMQESRVLHGENISDDACCSKEENNA